MHVGTTIREKFFTPVLVKLYVLQLDRAEKAREISSIFRKQYFDHLVLQGNDFEK